MVDDAVASAAAEVTTPTMPTTSAAVANATANATEADDNQFIDVL